MSKEIIFTPIAPKAIGPYSQAVKVNGMLFVSGQVPLNPETMEIVSSDVNEQTKQVMRNLDAILKEAGYNFEDVVKTTIFIKNMNDFANINKIYGDYFPTVKPARSTIEVARLPKDVLVEIEMIAIKGE